MNIRNISIVFLICFILIVNSGATESIANLLEQEQHSVRYSLASTYMEEGAFVSEDIYDSGDFNSLPKRKSPAKAFVMSLVVPGLGQFYNGSKIKPFAFLGVEITSWVFYSKWHSEGDNITAEFESFHDSLWNKSDYEDFLEWTYGFRDDDLITAEEVSHHLPDTKTQQYYEMTGKYNQFAWGWDDAKLGDNTLDHYSSTNPPPRILGDPSNTPVSLYRIEYEQKRKDADDNYRKASRMVIVSVVNHVLSAFEAYIMAKRYNSKLDETGGTILSQINVKPSIKSYYSYKDTPYLTLTYKF